MSGGVPLCCRHGAMMASRLVVAFTRRGRASGGAIMAQTLRAFSAQAPASVVFPRERPGLDYKLNWSLNADDVTPSQDAYRNADASLLGSKSKGKVPASGDVKILEAGQSLSFDDFETGLAAIKKSLEAAELYVEDGTSNSAGSLGVRVIADSAAYALAAKQLLTQDGVGWPFKKAVTVYVSASGKAFSAVQFEGSKSTGISGAVIGLSGPSLPLTAVKDAITFAAKALSEKK